MRTNEASLCISGLFPVDRDFPWFFCRNYNRDVWSCLVGHFVLRGFFVMVLLLHALKPSQFLKQKRILIQDKKANKASKQAKQSTISSSFPYSVVPVRRPSTIPLLEVEALVVS